MKKTFSFFLVLAQMLFSFGEEAIVSFDFVMQDIQDIVYAVSIAQDISIVCDDTVFGTTSFRFTGSSFEKAGEAFLRSNRLYAKRENGVIVLSKVQIVKKKGTAKIFTVNAYDIEPAVLFNKLSEASNIPISFELLPTTKISLHVENATIGDAVSIVVKSFPEYSVSVNDNSISIIKNTRFTGSKSILQHSGGDIFISEVEGQYTIDIQNGSLFECLEKIFVSSKVEFCNLLDADRTITRLVFERNSLHEVLAVLCSQTESAFTLHDGMYIVYGMQNASDELINANRFWKTIFLSHITTDVFKPLFQERFSNLKLIILSSSKAQVRVTEKDSLELDEFISLCDVPVKTHLIELQYISTDTLIAHLPPGIKSNQFSDLGTGYSLYFTGSDDSYQILKESLKVIDMPAVIIGYDLLVLQIQESDSFNWRPEFSAKNVSLGDKTGITGHLGSVFALNLDVVSIFGYTFAAELQTAIGENKAKVYVDTKLQGISGSPIHFQNTNTFRYQDTAIDPDTGYPVYSGITREIIAGLVLHIEGWVSGDGMVTTKVTASLSRRGADVSDSGNPPPTSEKVVTTEVRGKSGEPIILSGLVQNDSTFVEEGTPIMSDIPLIGWLFKSKQSNEEKSEMIIYLVPHVDGRGPVHEF